MMTNSASKKATKGARVILLQTARAVAINGTEQVSIRILLDSGSQLSYITKDLQECLRIKPTYPKGKITIENVWKLRV